MIILRTCLEYAERLRKIVSRNTLDTECMMFSGGIDTSFILLSYEKPENLMIFTTDLGGRDISYVKKILEKINIREHVIIRISEEEYEDSIDWVLKNFKTIDPVEVSGDIVHYMTIREALKRRCRKIVSGDGGDELFLGYSFLLSKDERFIREWIKRYSEGEARLPTVEVGSRLGVEVVTPLYVDETRSLAREIPLSCLIDPSKRFGKYFMRLYIAERGFPEIAWRTKDPVNTGSGSIYMLHRIVSRFIREMNIEDVYKEIENRMMFKPPTKTHTYLAWRMIRSSIDPPSIYLGEGSCPICRRRLVNRYCPFCGAYVDENRIIHHYTDEEF